MRLSDRLKQMEQSRQLNQHEATLQEVEQHILKATKVLGDARRTQNSLEGRFENAYSASHSLLMAAIKMEGYRPGSEKGHRQILYQLLEHLLPGAAGSKDVLNRAHGLRNRQEYDGDDIDVTQGFVDDLIAAVVNVQQEVHFNFKAFKNAPVPPKATPP